MKRLVSFIILLSIPLLNAQKNAKVLTYSKSFNDAKILNSDTLLIVGYLSALEKSYPAAVFYNLATQETKKIEIPPSFENRRIYTFLPTLEENKYLTLSQWENGDSDNIQIHLWNSTKNTWDKLNEVECLRMESFVAKPHEIQFACSSLNQLDKKGKPLIEEKRFPYAKGIQTQSTDKSIQSLQVASGNPAELVIRFSPVLKRKNIVLHADKVLENR